MLAKHAEGKHDQTLARDQKKSHKGIMQGTRSEELTIMMSKGIFIYTR